VSSWVSVLEQLASLDPSEFELDALSDEQVRDLIPLAQLGINRMSALQTRAVGAGEARQVHTGDGMASMKPWLTGHCRISGREAAGLVRAGGGCGCCRRWMRPTRPVRSPPRTSRW
jgi:hypothetical protein